jgi:hypothetical protein
MRPPGLRFRRAFFEFPACDAEIHESDALALTVPKPAAQL